MLLAANQGTDLIFEFDGPEQEKAQTAVTELFEDYVDYINYKNLLTFSNNKPKSFSQFTKENL